MSSGVISAGQFFAMFSMGDDSDDADDIKFEKLFCVLVKI